MRRTILRIPLPIVLGLAAAATLAADPTLPRVQVSFDPPTPRLEAGETRTIAVRVSGVPEPGLAAFQITLEYDPGVVAVRDPNAEFTAFGVPTFAPLGGSPLCPAVRRLPTCRDPEWLLTRDGRQPFGTSKIDNRVGRTTIGFATASAEATGSERSSAPATGDGALALIEVTSVSGGETGLRFGEVIVADSSDPPRRFDVERMQHDPR